jgi:diguanylate cyclase (GGDEF)-like protein
MDRIVLLMQEKKSAALMRERLANNYQVLETEIEQSLDFSFDLGIVDEFALKQSWEEVQSRKEAAKLVFLPFLLVAARRHAASVSRHLWQTVDEIIWTPINQLELQTRVENLLRTRRLSLEAQRLTTADLITGVHNRRYFFTLGNRELNRARRFKRPLSVLMAEVDHFQGICDNYDYEVGNQALRLTAKRFLKNLRVIDVMGRYAEEKFVILLTDTDMNGAEKVAERLVQEVGETHLNTDRGSVTPTISLGISSANGDLLTLESLVERADNALCAAKQAGRCCYRMERVHTNGIDYVGPGCTVEGPGI